MLLGCSLFLWCLEMGLQLSRSLEDNVVLVALKDSGMENLDGEVPWRCGL